ncbi:putative gluconokinase isoform 2-T4 [Trichechus inunguis]
MTRPLQNMKSQKILIININHTQSSPRTHKGSPYIQSSLTESLRSADLELDRIPWLYKLHGILLREIASGERVVLACSALKKMYRDILIRGKDGTPRKHDELGKEEEPPEVKLFVVHLSGSFEVISGRLLKRKGHFMPPKLLQSQFNTLEPPSAPENFIQISVDKELSEIITTIMEALKVQ